VEFDCIWHGGPSPGRPAKEVAVSTYEQLTSLQQLLSTLVLEHDDEALLTRLRDGQPLPALAHANIPMEELSASALQVIEYYAHSLVERVYGRMGIPRGEWVVRSKALDASVE
jgi:hypothetical protein